MSRKTGSTTAKNSGRKKKKGGPGRPFKKNNPTTGEKDERINRNGAPRKFDELREMVLNILSEEPDKKSTQLDTMLRNWVISQDYQKQAKLLEYGFGKVPDEIHMHFDIDNFIKKNLSLFTDGQLTRLASGESPMNILAEVLNDVGEFMRKKKSSS